jgi:hypothetical protein
LPSDRIEAIVIANRIRFYLFCDLFFVKDSFWLANFYAQDLEQVFDAMVISIFKFQWDGFDD